jgi:effector-binding domain-containing protein
MNLSLQVRLTQVDSIPLAVVRRRARPSELATVVPRSCGLVWDYLRSQELRGGRHVAIYLNSNIDLEVGIELATAFGEGSDVVRSATPHGLAATVVYHGPYQGLGAAHEAVRTWCQSEGYRLAGPNWEIYGHWQPEWNTDPSRIRTDVFYQVVEAGRST